MRRFQMGDRVVYDPGTKNHVAPDGVYDIVAVLPREDNVDEYLYRIKSVKEPAVRVAPESQLEPFTEDRFKERRA